MSTLLWFILTFILVYFIQSKLNTPKSPSSEIWKYSKYSRRNHDYQSNPEFTELEKAEYEIIK